MPKQSYFLLYKPYGMLSQFTREQPGQRVLGELHHFPKDAYPLGRLDQDSEGLLIVTNDGRLNHLLLNPKHAHRRTYWAQVEGQPDEAALQQLREGVEIRAKGKSFRTLPASARLLMPPPALPERDPPIRYRKTVPDAWLELQLTEGKNRQVRRMCAAVGFPVLRLVRAQIVDLSLQGLMPGEVRELDKANCYRLLGLG